jgi:hypothetical protein
MVYTKVLWTSLYFLRATKRAPRLWGSPYTKAGFFKFEVALVYTILKKHFNKIFY